MRPSAPPSAPTPLAGTLVRETWLVLGVSLGASAIWSLLSILRTLNAGPIAQQTITMNSSRSTQAWLDFLHQFAGVALGVIPAFLALHLLARDHPKPAIFLGLQPEKLTVSHLARPLSIGMVLAVAIGVPGLGLYMAARHLGINAKIAASGLHPSWWAVLMLILAAIGHAVLEETIMLGYLFTRWRQAQWGWVRIIVLSAFIRATYHLYQGVGGFLGNFAMGLIFGWLYRRTRKLLPFVIAHALLDIAAFVGYTYLRQFLPAVI